jgi:hypothetical protein
VWIAILVSVLLIAAPVHADTIVDQQVQVDAGDLALVEVTVPAPQAPTPTIVPVPRQDAPSPAPARGRVFRPPRGVFA